MLFSYLPSILLLGAAAAAPALDDDVARVLRRQVPSKTCSHITGGIHVIAMGGANTNNPRDYGLLGSLAGSILSAIPGSTNVSLPYDKVLASTSPPSLHPNAISDGMRLLKNYVVNYHHCCPNTKIALIGYSSGAVIMMNDLCFGGNGVNSPQLNPLIEGNVVVASVAYGEETRAPGQPWDLGTCKNYGGTHQRADSGKCYPYGNHLQSYCDTGDPDCCAGSPNENVNIHFSYPAKYDAKATRFIKNRFYAAGGP